MNCSISVKRHLNNINCLRLGEPCYMRPQLFGVTRSEMPLSVPAT